MERSGRAFHPLCFPYRNRWGEEELGFVYGFPVQARVTAIRIGNRFDGGGRIAAVEFLEVSRELNAYG